ncbi:MAG: diaminohydroxyphosphoribosylaminopyrimidine deaminase [Sediminibacterium sp.]|nr:diaminohydroxyphosphoribosylaminopyrimidine deaminase [Sediminibacterium sp.]
MTDRDESYMRRCIELAQLGAGQVAPNPMVGAVLVYEDRIIGEGYHRAYGQPHAEVNCINSVAPADQPVVSRSTLYVSLEPCAHFGKTPPCADLIIQHGIPKVVIGCRDPFPEVNGKGIEKLENAGVAVTKNVLENESRQLNKRFFTFHTKQRPYIILKWAQTADGKIGSGSEERLRISNPHSNRLVHQWRSEEAAILVGTNTALLDDPSLDNRLWTGKSPVRLVMDLSLRLPKSLKLFNGEQPTIIFNQVMDKEEGNLRYYRLTGGSPVIAQVLAACHTLNLQSILVEGGAKLLQSFISAGAWDEARVVVNNELTMPQGLAAPLFEKPGTARTEKMLSDTIHYCVREEAISRQ